MHRLVKRRETWVIVAMLLLVGAATVAARMSSDDRGSAGLGAFAFRELSTQGTEDGGAGGESAEGLTAAQQWAEARTAPGGIVAPGAYSAAFSQLTGLPVTGGSWDEVTDVPYDIDSPEYRDFFSNSGGGQGKQVTGRVTGLAADDDGHVYAGSANGGVWRSSTGGRNWTPIADGIPSLSTGALALDASGALWYATGEANTGGTTYVGNGVYRLANPTAGVFAFPADRVGGTELESTSINAVRFGGNRAWVATSRGIWWHDRSTNAGAWTLSFAPNPSYLPGGANANASNAPFKNWVNDLLVDPNDASHMIAAVGYRNGDAYNGLYESTNTGGTWTRVNTLGGLDLNDIGNVTFAWSARGERLYLINQSPRRITSGRAFPQTYLDGIYMSKNGSLTGPWSKIASSDKLAQSGSALHGNQGKGYSPGIQAWYNQLLIVDPTNPQHVVAGLEEVYDTVDAGNNWRTIGPYWNFYFSCWNLDAVYDVNGGGNRCPLTTHPDQHSVAIGKVDGTYRLFIGNDGGVYSRPLNGSLNRNGNATDWKSLNDGTMDALQYYSVAVGKVDPAEAHNPPGATAGKVLVSGGLQDNGGSIYLSGDAVQYSNYGGDGGDSLVNPDNGCEILQEYTYLALRLTPDCGRQSDPEAFNDINRSTERSIAPPEINARFTAPFAASDTNKNEWIAGGNSIWFQDKGFAIRSGAEWQRVHTWGPAVRVTTALAMSGNTAIAAWCGPCGIIGFQRGLAVGTHNVDGSWTWKDSTTQSLVGVPNRYIGGVAVKGNHLYLGLNGFDRRFSEGPGNGLGQVFESTNGGDTWTDIGGGTFPNIPVNSIKAGPNGSLVVGTDLGVLVRANASAAWTRLGGNFPATVAIDIEFGPDGNIYAATHGRGIWKIAGSVAAG